MILLFCPKLCSLLNKPKNHFSIVLNLEPKAKEIHNNRILLILTNQDREQTAMNYLSALSNNKILINLKIKPLKINK